MKFSLTNDLEELETLAVKLTTFGESENLSPVIVQQLNLALDELVTNAIQYGFENGKKGLIEIELERDEKQVTAILSDNGRSFDPFQTAEPDISLPVEERQVGGLGVFLVRQLMDEYSYRREKNRNRIRLSKHLEAEEKES